MLKTHPILRVSLWLLLLAISAGSIVFTGTLLYLGPKLPEVEQILEIQLQTPLRIYSSEGKLIAEFGEKKRSPILYEDIPQDFVHAVLAAEDARFFKHHGVDIKGLVRASLELVTTGSIQTGGSTITMQVAKNYFLSRERTFLRKFNEILLSLDMERKLSKEQILELYINKIYLGHRAYGIQAAAQVYYGNPVQALTLAQLATIAGLPKAPSAYNPVTNPARALSRRNWILSRMLELRYIDQQQHDTAVAELETAELHGIPVEVEAPYFAEMVRRDMIQRFGDRADTDGYRVYTTLKADLQTAANTATLKGLIDYDRRHGYRGEEAKLGFPLEEVTNSDLLAELRRFRTIGILQPAIITSASDESADALLKTGETITLTLDGMKWARRYIDNVDRGPEPKKVSDVVQPGQIVRVTQEKEGWSLAQKPIAQSGMTSFDPKNGALLALVGGFDFQSSKFNRAIQGGRQAGSSFKPFIYSAALEKGLTPATIINDAPVVFEDSSLESTWRPENSGGRFYGPTRLRQALYKSRNLVSIRVLRQIGIRHTIEHASRFGFDTSKLPNNLSLALGSAALTPWEIASAYMVLANGGYLMEPWYIQRIEDNTGTTLFEANPMVICDETCIQQREAQQAATDSEGLDFATLLAQEASPEPETNDTPDSANSESDDKPVRYAERVQDARINFLITSMLQDVIKRGTGVKARVLNRSDIAGKTGTTNDQKDAWFSGFNRDIVATVWVGFDQPRNLGRGEYGGTAALPIWIDYMRTALKDSPQTPLKIPDGITTVRIDPETGKRAKPGQPNAIFEYFREENVPAQEVDDDMVNPHTDGGTLPEQLF
ncbi:penicillin-binding protein 1A [Ketobacter alkanivorans]|uniref:Penicillin-binding protein 1A n=1 Tax=Ketobacter alkanivorans TaxID=1917421 RepID=A0A2K9LN32_9GAMM|nr:penicillin-binding protein 1A [Ketobacter alkanivorans]AUM13766.1 peptidase [Ketobacter alkanivorans]